MYSPFPVKTSGSVQPQRHEVTKGISFVPLCLILQLTSNDRVEENYALQSLLTSIPASTATSSVGRY